MRRRPPTLSVGWYSSALLTLRKPHSCCTGSYNDTRSGWDVAADYFLLVTHLATVGQGVLAVESEDPDVLVYAHCAKGPNVKVGPALARLVTRSLFVGVEVVFLEGGGGGGEGEARRGGGRGGEWATCVSPYPRVHVCTCVPGFPCPLALLLFSLARAQ